MIDDRKWKLFAQRRRTRDVGKPFYQFGTQEFADLGAGAGISSVELIESVEGDYYAWMPNRPLTPTSRPILISESMEELIQRFQGGDLTENIQRSEREGKGSVIRLDVREVDKIS